MNSLVRSPANVSHYIKVSKQVIGSVTGDKAAPFKVPEEGVKFPSPPLQLTSSSLAASAPKGQLLAQAAGFGVLGQVRLAHTDIQSPNFDYYRKDELKDPTACARDSEDSRKVQSYMMLTVGGIGAAYSAKSAVTQFVANMAASADVLAMSKVEVNIAEIGEGQNMTFKWRGKPLFVRRRTAAEIQKENEVDITQLRDPQTDADRVQKPEWLVLIGVCTHLGCVPIPNVGDYKGYFCPCHGSHYDASGRIRKGPAPLNLEIPPYEFTTDTTLVVG